MLIERARPAFPPNRELLLGERPCPICGYGERQHRYRADERPPRGHHFPFTRLQRAVAWLSLRIWPTAHALYVLGRIGTP